MFLSLWGFVSNFHKTNPTNQKLKKGVPPLVFLICC